MNSEQLRGLAEMEREIARRIMERAPAYRHDPAQAQAASNATMRAEALEAMAST